MKVVREIAIYLLVFIAIAIILYCISGCSNSYEEYTVKSDNIETINFNFGQGQVVVKEYIAPNGKTFYIFKSLSSGDIDVIPADLQVATLAELAKTFSASCNSPLAQTKDYQ